MPTLYHTALPLLTPAQASQPASNLLEGSLNKMGFVPNLYAAMANHPATLETYLLGYERFRTSSSFSPAEQEVVFLTISAANECPYCMAAHTFVGERVTHVPPTTLDALRSGTQIPDARLRALSDFTRALLRTRGRPTETEAREFLDAGFTEVQVLAVILAIAVKTISNYTNHIFATPLDPAFAGAAVRGDKQS